MSASFPQPVSQNTSHQLASLSEEQLTAKQEQTSEASVTAERPGGGKIKVKVYYDQKLTQLDAVNDLEKAMVKISTLMKTTTKNMEIVLNQQHQIKNPESVKAQFSEHLENEYQKLEKHLLEKDLSQTEIATIQQKKDFIRLQQYGLKKTKNLTLDKLEEIVSTLHPSAKENVSATFKVTTVEKTVHKELEPTKQKALHEITEGHKELLKRERMFLSNIEDTLTTLSQIKSNENVTPQDKHKIDALYQNYEKMKAASEQRISNLEMTFKSDDKLAAFIVQSQSKNVQPYLTQLDNAIRDIPELYRLNETYSKPEEKSVRRDLFTTFARHLTNLNATIPNLAKQGRKLQEGGIEEFNSADAAVKAGAKTLDEIQEKLAKQKDLTFIDSFSQNVKKMEVKQAAEQLVSIAFQVEGYFQDSKDATKTVRSKLQLTESRVDLTGNVLSKVGKKTSDKLEAIDSFLDVCQTLKKAKKEKKFNATSQTTRILGDNSKKKLEGLRDQLETDLSKPVTEKLRGELKAIIQNKTTSPADKKKAQKILEKFQATFKS